MVPSVAAAVSAEPALTELTSANFDSVILHSGKPAFVDFFAYFCGRKPYHTLLKPYMLKLYQLAKNLPLPTKSLPTPFTVPPSQ